MLVRSLSQLLLAKSTSEYFQIQARLDLPGPRSNLASLVIKLLAAISRHVRADDTLYYRRKRRCINKITLS